MEGMTANLVNDPLLLSVLASAAEARRQSLAILDLISDYPSRDTEPENNDLQELSRQQKLLNSHLAQLRALNRKAILGVRSTKQETTEARQEIDSLHLQLQNLNYEQRHLRGEIQACRDYRHTYEDINMLPLDEFLERNPDHEESSELELTEARIRDEHAQRLALEAQRQGLIKNKEALVKETTAKKEELAKLDTEAERWIAESEVLRKLLEAHEKKVAAANEVE